jgi:hypothetical protein
MASRNLPCNLLEHALLRLFRHPLPQLRVHRPGTHNINPNRLQINCQIPNHTMQARRKAGYHTPPWHRLLGYTPCSENDTAFRGFVFEIATSDFGDEERRDESYLSCADYVFICRVLERDSGEFVAGGEDDVVYLAACFEQFRDVFFNGGLREVADMARDFWGVGVRRVGCFEGCDGRGDAVG